MASKTFTLPYDFNDEVIIDGREDVIAKVTGYNFRGSNEEIGVSWWNERDHRSAWFHPRRISPAPLKKQGKIL